MNTSHKISITALVVSSVLSASAFAEDNLQTKSSVENISDLSSTVDTPNNLYDFIDNDKLKGVAYAGAELGGNVLLDDQNDSDFQHGYMFKVGADFTYTINDSFALLLGGESRYEWTGFDSSVDATNYVDRFQFGMLTKAGTTTFGKQCGIADVYAGFGDISKEYGIGTEVDEVACTDELANHHYFGGNFDVGVSFDHETDSWAVGGSFTFGPVIIGGTYVTIDDSSDLRESVDDSEEEAGTVGAVAQFDKLTVAAKWGYNNVEGKGEAEGMERDTTIYAAGVAYDFTQNFSVAGTYNYEDVEYKRMSEEDYDDDYITLGASYIVNEHLELVTDYKFASDEDDKIFLRANVNL